MVTRLKIFSENEVLNENVSEKEDLRTSRKLTQIHHKNGKSFCNIG